jgi:hypothetical protein
MSEKQDKNMNLGLFLLKSTELRQFSRLNGQKREGYTMVTPNKGGIKQ